MKRRKILMVLNRLEIGGAETHVVDLSSALQQMGWDVLVASGGGVYEETLRELGIRHYYVPADVRSMVRMRRGPCPRKNPGVPLRPAAEKDGIPPGDHCPLDL